MLMSKSQQMVEMSYFWSSVSVTVFVGNGRHLESLEMFRMTCHYQFPEFRIIRHGPPCKEVQWIRFWRSGRPSNCQSADRDRFHQGLYAQACHKDQQRHIATRFSVRWLVGRSHVASANHQTYGRLAYDMWRHILVGGLYIKNPLAPLSCAPVVRQKLEVSAVLQVSGNTEPTHSGHWKPETSNWSSSACSSIVLASHIFIPHVTR